LVFDGAVRDEKATFFFFYIKTKVLSLLNCFPYLHVDVEVPTLKNQPFRVKFLTTVLNVFAGPINNFQLRYRWSMVNLQLNITN